MQSEQPLLITEDKYIQPLKEVLNDVTPQPPEAPKKLLNESPSLKESLDNLFPEQQYDEKDIQKAKEILAETAQQFTPVQLKETITKMQYLTETWLDDFERNIFDGITLKELLHEKGSL